MIVSLKLLRVIPDRELVKFGITLNQNEVFCNPGFSEHEIPLGAQFDLQKIENDTKHQVVEKNLFLLKEVLHYKENLDIIPIGTRVTCRFFVGRKGIDIVKSLPKDEEGYLLAEYELIAHSLFKGK